MQTYPLLSYLTKFSFCFKRISILVIAFFSFHFGDAQTSGGDEFILSPRVGRVLDSVEVEYFNIFPDLDGVKSVIYRRDMYENLKMLVSLANGTDTTITFSKLQTEQLQILINQFEHLPDNPDLVNWRLLPGYQLSKMNFYESTGRNLKLKTTQGNFFGRMVLVSDSVIYLWMKKGDYDPALHSQYVKKIYPKDIISWEVKPSFSSKIFGASLGAGLAVGALQLGFNVTGESDYLLSSNSVVILGIGGLLGSLGGFFFDEISASSKKRDIYNSPALYSIYKENLKPKAMFYSVFPPEFKNFP